MPVATETLSERVPPSWGKDSNTSHSFETPARKPRPSEPTARTAGCVQSKSCHRRSARGVRPTVQNPALRSARSAVAAPRHAGKADLGEGARGCGDRGCRWRRRTAARHQDRIHAGSVGGAHQCSEVAGILDPVGEEQEVWPGEFRKSLRQDRASGSEKPHTLLPGGEPHPQFGPVAGSALDAPERRGRAQSGAPPGGGVPAAPCAEGAGGSDGGGPGEPPAPVPARRPRRRRCRPQARPAARQAPRPRAANGAAPPRSCASRRRRGKWIEPHQRLRRKPLPAPGKTHAVGGGRLHSDGARRDSEQLSERGANLGNPEARAAAVRRSRCSPPGPADIRRRRRFRERARRSGGSRPREAPRPRRGKRAPRSGAATAPKMASASAWSSASPSE